MAQFYAIIPAGHLPNLEQIEGKFAFNHFANHRADGRHLIYVNEGDADSFQDFVDADAELASVTTDAGLPADYLTHWEQILQPGTSLPEIEDNFVGSTADFVAP